MGLTDADREKLAALAQDTYDPELWTEDDLPALRAARRQFEQEQQATGERHAR